MIDLNPGPAEAIPGVAGVAGGTAALAGRAPRLEQVRVAAHELERGRGHTRVHAARWDGPGGGAPGGGAPGGGVPVAVCVHGLGGSLLNWTLLAPRLRRRAAVWALDLAGCGSTVPGERSCGLEDSVDLLRGFVRTVSPGRPVVLLGNSMGGLIACTLAGRNPELVAGLVLLGPAVPPIGGWPRPLVLARFAIASVPGLGEAWLRHRGRWLTPAEQVREALEINTSDPDAVDGGLIRAQVRQAAARQRLPHARSAVLAATRTLIWRLGPARRRLWADVAAVRAPTLVLHGRLDRLVDERAIGALAARRPDWRLRVYEDLGHVVMLERPDRVARDVSAWLRERVDPAVGGRRDSPA